MRSAVRTQRPSEISVWLWQGRHESVRAAEAGVVTVMVVGEPAARRR